MEKRRLCYADVDSSFLKELGCSCGVHNPTYILHMCSIKIFVGSIFKESFLTAQAAADVSAKDSLLSSAKNGLAVKILSKGKEVSDEPVVDNTMNRQKGWERMVLQILFLGPSNLLEPNASFSQMSQKLIVSPIVKTLVFSKVPEKVQDWIDRIARDWRFKRIIPAHFAAPINASRYRVFSIRILPFSMIF
ncbi:hypothetical protein Salat_2174400 [Sesamum alatum]|uniref:Uncharacterized protein n=1 Tax=Sesamum alatum TaxID=300844 RepID=A0AAE2CD19_9LAMI|nr:hypothetical protein Salat_2174400 [Sesamum alatum]